MEYSLEEVTILQIISLQICFFPLSFCLFVTDINKFIAYHSPYEEHRIEYCHV
jgi:hypothetical protein